MRTNFSSRTISARSIELRKERKVSTSLSLGMNLFLASFGYDKRKFCYWQFSSKSVAALLCNYHNLEIKISSDIYKCTFQLNACVPFGVSSSDIFGLIITLLRQIIRRESYEFDVPLTKRILTCIASYIYHANHLI